MHHRYVTTSVCALLKHHICGSMLDICSNVYTVVAKLSVFTCQTFSFDVTLRVGRLRVAWKCYAVLI